MSSNAKKQPILGAGLMILSAFLWTGLSVLVKLASHHVSTTTVVFSRFFISLILILPWILKVPKEIFKIPNPFQVIIRSLLGFAIAFCFFFALKYITIADALLLNNTFPLFIPIIVYFTAHIKLSPRIWLGIILGFIGIACVLHPGLSLFQPASLVALLSGILVAIVLILVQALTKKMPVVKVLFYNYLIGALLTGAFLYIHWKTPTPVVLLLLIGIGALSGIYQFCFTKALSKADAHFLAPLTYISIPIGVIADYFVWNQIPDLWSILGMVLVIIGGVITLLSNTPSTTITEG